MNIAKDRLFIMHYVYDNVCMRGLHNFKTTTKETGGNRNMDPTENAANLIDCKEMKR